VNKRTTLADVAREAGVSHQTVSRAVNDKGEIDPDTRARVLEIARRLDYHPNYFARSLVTRQTTTIGIIIPDITNPFFSEIVRGVEDCAREHSYNLFLCNTDEDPQREASSLDSLLEKRVDGVILCSSRLEESDLVSKLEEYPFAILINRDIQSTLDNVAVISFDDTLGAQLAMSHFIEQGHRQIAFLAGPRRSHSGEKRREGYTSSLRKNGIRILPNYVLPCEPNIESGHQAAQTLLAAHPEVTAILCYNDLIAIGACLAGKSLGRAIPNDLSIIGCDDIPMAALFRPRLTSLRSPKREAGRNALQALIEMMQGKQASEISMVISPELIVRETTSLAPDRPPKQG